MQLSAGLFNSNRLSAHSSRVPPAALGVDGVTVEPVLHQVQVLRAQTRQEGCRRQAHLVQMVQVVQMVYLVQMMQMMQMMQMVYLVLEVQMEQ